MKMKLTLAALALVLAPGIAAAMCSAGKAHEQASQCLQGQTWDAATQTCIAPVSS